MSQIGQQNALLPSVSVIIPVYNGEQFLAAALESVLQQGYAPLEIIVVDDGSTDRSASIACSFGEQVRYVYQANAGPAVARNHGVALAKSTIIAFLDADDLWPADKLHLQVAQLTNDPALQIVWGRYQIIVPWQSAIGAREFREFANPALGPLLGSMVIRKDVFDQVGVFDAAFTPSDDVDWIMRVREAGCSLKVISPVTLFYRLHGQNLTHHKTLVQMKHIQALRQSLIRRRQMSAAVAFALPHLLAKD